MHWLARCLAWGDVECCLWMRWLALVNAWVGIWLALVDVALLQSVTTSILTWI